MSSEWRSTQRVIWWEKRVGMRLERGVRGDVSGDGDSRCLQSGGPPNALSRGRRGLVCD